MVRVQRLEYFDIDELYSGFDSACFDSDLIENPYHPKLFTKLSGVTSELDENFLQHIYSKSNYLEIFCFLGAALLAAVFVHSFPQWWVIAEYKPRQAVFDIRLRPPTEPKTVDTKPDEIINSESQIIDSNLDQRIIKVEEKEVEVDDDIPPIDVLKPRVIIRDQIQDFVRNSLVQDTMENDFSTNVQQITIQQGLTAPGLVFDSSLRETLASDKIKQLNRWRAPENLQGSLAENGIDLDELEIDMMGVTISGDSSQYSKIGNDCYRISFNDNSSNSPSVPLMGNGWNLSGYAKVHCDLLYLNDPLRREDVKKAGSLK